MGLGMIDPDLLLILTFSPAAVYPYLILVLIPFSGSINETFETWMGLETYLMPPTESCSDSILLSFMLMPLTNTLFCFL